jgi:hypothetical protein
LHVLQRIKTGFGGTGYWRRGSKTRAAFVSAQSVGYFICDYMSRATRKSVSLLEVGRGYSSCRSYRQTPNASATTKLHSRSFPNQTYICVGKSDSDFLWFRSSYFLYTKKPLISRGVFVFLKILSKILSVGIALAKETATPDGSFRWAKN